MADHYVSLNRGKTGLTASDFADGTASEATDDIELRVLDGQSLTTMDVLLALEAFKIYFQSKLAKAAGFDVSP